MRRSLVFVIAMLLVAMIAVLAITTIPPSHNSTTTSSFSSVLSSTSVPTTGQVGSWNRTTSYPLPLAAMSCVSSDGFAYCVGGGDEAAPRGSGGLNVTYYAPLSTSGVGQWIKTTDYPLAVQNPSCVTNSGYIYCVS